MDAKTFYETYGTAESERVAKEAGTSLGYFRLIVGGHRKPGPAMVRRLVIASGGMMSREDLRPDWFRPDLQEPEKTSTAA